MTSVSMVWIDMCCPTERTLNVLYVLSSKEWYVKLSMFCDSHKTQIHETFECCNKSILLALSSIHFEWYHILQSSQQTARL